VAGLLKHPHQQQQQQLAPTSSEVGIAEFRRQLLDKAGW